MLEKAGQYLKAVDSVTKRWEVFRKRWGISENIGQYQEALGIVKKTFGNI